MNASSTAAMKPGAEQTAHSKKAGCPQGCRLACQQRLCFPLSGMSRSHEVRCHAQKKYSHGSNVKDQLSYPLARRADVAVCMSLLQICERRAINCSRTQWSRFVERNTRESSCSYGPKQSLSVSRVIFTGLDAKPIILVSSPQSLEVRGLI